MGKAPKYIKTLKPPQLLASNCPKVCCIPDENSALLGCWKVEAEMFLMFYYTWVLYPKNAVCFIIKLKLDQAFDQPKLGPSSGTSGLPKEGLNFGWPKAWSSFNFFMLINVYLGTEPKKCGGKKNSMVWAIGQFTEYFSQQFFLKGSKILKRLIILWTLKKKTQEPQFLSPVKQHTHMHNKTYLSFLFYLKLFLLWVSKSDPWALCPCFLYWLHFHTAALQPAVVAKWGQTNVLLVLWGFFFKGREKKKNTN